MGMQIVGLLFLVLGLGVGFTADSAFQSSAWFQIALIGAVFVGAGGVERAVHRLRKQQRKIEAVRSNVALAAVEQRLEQVEIAASDRRRPPDGRSPAINQPRG